MLLLWLLLALQAGSSSAAVFFLSPLGGASRSQLAVLTVLKCSVRLRSQAAGHVIVCMLPGAGGKGGGQQGDGSPVVPAQFGDRFPSCGLSTPR